MKFSIIVPVYNVAQFLPYALESVLCQTYDNWECICVDDGSTDASGKMLDSYASRDRRIKVFHQPNRGVASARNFALDIANGDWIVFLDADDLLRLDALYVLQNATTDNSDVDLIVFERCDFVDGSHPNWDLSHNQNVLEDITTFLRIEDICRHFSCYAYSQKFLGDLRFHPYCVGEDRLFLGNALVKAHLVYRVNDIFYAYRIRLGSAMHSKETTKKLNDRIGYSKEWVEALLNSQKLIPSAFFHLVAVHLTESFVDGIRQQSTEDQKILWREWYDLLLWMRDRRMHFSRWTRFVISTCLIMRCHCVAYVLCLLPLKLKLMGLHRR